MANGNFGGGNGTILNPYLVEDAYDLDAVRNYLGDTTVHFKQVSDIDLSSWGNWEPIQNGTSTSNSDVFRGYYDGGGFKIANMTCQHDRNYVGLFGYASNATIKNVFVENCNVSGSNDVGGLVGSNSSSTISNCYSSGNVGGINYVGGLAGSNSSSTILNCYSSGNVSGINYVGGLAGHNSTSSTISNCYSSGIVSGSNDVGGLAGYNSTSSTILNCYALNPFIARASGSSSSSFSDISNSGIIENCFSLDTLEFRQL